MKCISLWQPWATLVAIGAKTCETRSWATLHRGPIAIHAAKTWNGELKHICRTYPFEKVLMRERPNQSGASYNEDALKIILPFGAIIATARIEDCYRIDPLRQPVDEQERAFGDYTTGRFCWVLSDVVKLAKPIPYTGRQGLFNVPDEIVSGSGTK